jgi:hypothetical protein
MLASVRMESNWLARVLVPSSRPMTEDEAGTRARALAEQRGWTWRGHVEGEVFEASFPPR